MFEIRLDFSFIIIRQIPHRSSRACALMKTPLPAMGNESLALGNRGMRENNPRVFFLLISVEGRENVALFFSNIFSGGNKLTNKNPSILSWL